MMFLQELPTSRVSDICILDYEDFNLRLKCRQRLTDDLISTFRYKHLGQLDQHAFKTCDFVQ